MDDDPRDGTVLQLNCTDKFPLFFFFFFLEVVITDLLDLY